MGRKPARSKAPRTLGLADLAPFAIMLFLIGDALGIYWQTRGHDFVTFDDPMYTIDNPNIESLSWRNLFWGLTTGYFFNWHPLTWWSYMIDYRLHGLNAGGFHLTNAILHALNAALLFEVLRRMTGAVGRSAFVASVFAAHPLHVESVAWIAERKDVLSALFWIVTMGVYAWYARRPSRMRYAALLSAYGIALMAKPMVVTLPFVLLLLDWWPLKRLRIHVLPVVDEPGSRKAPARAKREHAEPAPSTRRRLILEKVPLIALAAFASVVTVVVQRTNGNLVSLERIAIATRFANAGVAYAWYLAKTFWPSGLAVFYPHPGNTLSIWQVSGSFVLLFFVTGGVCLFGIPGCQRRLPPRLANGERGYLLTGWFWYLGTLVPTIGLIQVGFQGMADRYTYIPMIGLSIAVTWGVADLAQALRVPRIALAAGAATTIGALTLLAAWQTQYWSDSITLYRHALDVVPANSRICNNLGELYAREKRYDEALKCFSDALKYAPDYPGIHSNLANIYCLLDRYDEAMPLYEQALELNPDDTDAHYNYGVALARTGKNDEAIRHYREAIRIRPDGAGAHTNLALELHKKGELTEAAQHYREALRIDPNDPSAQKNYVLVVEDLKNAGLPLPE